MAGRKGATRSRPTGTGHARDYTAIALAYAKKAAADRKQVRHCKWVRLAAQRHLDDLQRAKKKDWPYRYDAWHGNDVCDFIEKLPHVEGDWCKCPHAAVGEHLDRCGLIDLEPFQIFILATVFGWRRKDNGRRRFTLVYEEEARKNAKSTKTAGVSLYALTCEDEPGPQVLTAATTFDQAKKVFHPAKRMVEKMPALQEAFGLAAWAKSITCADNGGYMQPLHSKSKSQDGHNPHLVTLDEFHAHSDRGLFDVLRSAFGARRQPLMWIITTAGFNINGPCYEQRSFATKVLERTVIAEHVFAIIFTIDRAEDYDDGRKVGDDPFDASKWIKANPLMEASQPLRDEVAKAAIEAKASPSQEGEFKTKHLNMWLGAASAWLNVTQWQSRADPGLRLRHFRGLDCYLGADLADKDDITAVALAALDSDGRLLVKTWFFLPDAALTRDSQAEKETVTLYKQWHEGRWLWTTPGDFVDHGRVKRLIRRLKRALHVRQLFGDQFAGMLTMASELNEEFDDGTEPFANILPKNAGNVADPAKDLEARVRAKEELLRHDGNPVMTWMIGNAVVERRVNGSILPKKDKPNSQNKIDGVDALVNAMKPMQVKTDGESALEKHGVRVL